MAQDLEKLVVQLSADYNKFENAMKRANRAMFGQLRQMEQNASSTVRKINASLGAIGPNTGKLAAGFLAGFSLQGAQQVIDTGTKITNSLKVAGLQGDDLKKTYEALFQSAQKYGAEIGTLATVYGRVAIVQTQLGITNQQLLQFSDTLAASLKAQGISATEAAGPMLQLSQALGSGVVRAEEYNSLIDGLPVVLRAVAAGLKEAGGDVTTLTNLVKNGEVSSKAFFAAFEAGTPLIQELASRAAPTLTTEFTKLYNILVDTAVKFNENSNIVQQMQPVFTDLASSIMQVGAAFNTAIGWANSFGEALNNINDEAVNFGAWLGEKTGLRNVGRMIEGAVGEVKDFQQQGAVAENVAKRINEAFGPLTAGGKGNRITYKPPEIKPVSLADYTVPKVAKEKAGRTKRTPEDRFDSDIQRVTDRTAALVSETEAQRQLNPMVDDYGYAMEKARTEQELLNAAQKAGVAITPELRAQIGQTAEQWALASAEAAKLAEAQDKIRQRAEEWQSTAQDATRGFVDDLIAGKSAAEALGNALDKVLDKLLDMAFDDIFTSLFKGNGGGGLLSFLGLKNGGVVKAATGGLIRGAGGPRSDSIPARLSNGEFVVNAKATKQNRALLEAINNGRALALANGGMVTPSLTAPTMPIIQPQSRSSASGPMHVDVGVSVDNNGNLQAYVKSVSQQTSQNTVKAYDKSGPMRLARDSKQAGRRGMLVR